MTSVQEVNPRVLAIREPTSLQSLAARISKEIEEGARKPFKTVIDVSSADPHRAGMAPLSFVRQVLAVCLFPELLEEQLFPLDVGKRAQRLLGACEGGSVGSYSKSSYGLTPVLESVARFITRRDGVTAHTEDIIFCGGSQKALGFVLHLMSSGEGKSQTAVLTPVPYPHTLPPLYEVSGVKLVPYQLMEKQGWAFDLDELKRALRCARQHCEPRAIYISNPGNPSGQVQDRRTMQDVIQFAAAEGLIILADEVYQDSVFGQDREFISYRKVLLEMDQKFSEMVELLSFHSLSNACLGECGLRGGYIEVINMEPQVKSYLKSMQAPSSPQVLAQLALEVMVNPPSAADPSYHTYTQEILHSRTTLFQNAQRACDFLNDLPGMSCQPVIAGVFVYPSLHIPARMIEEAKMLGLKADVFYCQKLLEEEGVCLGAGCENGQEDENFHIRMSVLAAPDALENVLARLHSFHLRLLSTFP